MKILYDYIEEHELLLIKWDGNWDFFMYKESIFAFLKIVEANNVKNLIQDITKLEFDINFQEFKQMVEIRKEMLIKDLNTVYITGKPNDVVFSSLYSDEFLNQFKYMFCSSYDKAFHLLSITMTSDDIMKRLPLLKDIMEY